MTAARDVFRAAGRTSEVAKIDCWLATAPPTPSWQLRDAGVAPDLPSRRDWRGLQP